ncbi:MAG: dihydroneopterin aldolase [Cyanobacteria bacterium]|nr:dihydroneopterin aldolase [Cyanobacteriota bacterium]MDW8203223.1 dihydroneopterin aldolase [Cyanobacteriota bacterium SKYGB_h_bin112]
MAENDRIELTGIRCYGYTGALPEEQVLGQWFDVSLSLWLDLTAVGRSDNLDDTLDYRQVIAIVRDLVCHQKFATIERLATAIAEATLILQSREPFVEQVQVRLTKLTPPIPDFAGQVTVEITRKR